MYKAMRSEGFWYSKYEPDLPMPKARDKPASNQLEILDRLSKREQKAQEVAYKGSSKCRICECSNGSNTRARVIREALGLDDWQ